MSPEVHASADEEPARREMEDCFAPGLVPRDLHRWAHRGETTNVNVTRCRPEATYSNWRDLRVRCVHVELDAGVMRAARTPRPPKPLGLRDAVGLAGATVRSPSEHVTRDGANRLETLTETRHRVTVLLERAIRQKPDLRIGDMSKGGALYLRPHLSLAVVWRHQIQFTRGLGAGPECRI